MLPEKRRSSDANSLSVTASCADEELGLMLQYQSAGAKAVLPPELIRELNEDSMHLEQQG